MSPSRPALLTVIDPEAEVTLPSPLIQEGYEGVDVGPAGTAAHDGAGRHHGELLRGRDGQPS